MEENELELRRSVQVYNVQKDIADVLFQVFPNDSFKQHFGIFEKAVNQPSWLSRYIIELENQLNLGLTSHVAIVARELLSLQNFQMFTREYMKRCCVLVEIMTKKLMAPQLQINVGRKSLGGVVKIFRNPIYDNLIPRSLVYNLDLFNAKIYCPVKHEVLDNKEAHMFSVSDAIATTFMSIKLCQQIQELIYKLRGENTELKQGKRIGKR